jgi:hypothetical protein
MVDLGALVAVGLWAAEDLMIDFFETAMGVTSRLNLLVRLRLYLVHAACQSFGQTEDSWMCLIKRGLSWKSRNCLIGAFSEMGKK